MRITATIQDGQDLNEVAARLTSAGLRVDQKLAEIGIVTGEVAEAALEGLGKVQGVLAVEPEGAVQLPPPDSPVQ